MSLVIQARLRPYVDRLPNVRSFLSSLVLGSPAYVQYRIEELRDRQNKERNCGHCERVSKWRKNKLVLQSFTIRIARKYWLDPDIYIHEAAHALDQIVQPGRNAAGVPMHCLSWGSAYSLCFALWNQEIRCLSARPGVLQYVQNNGELKEVVPL